MKSIKVMQAIALSTGMALAGLSTAYACGDGSCEPPAPTTKGNNGWGQEKNKGTTDGTNNGSDDGATSDSKSLSTQR
jgi:hypothetical protein